MVEAFRLTVGGVPKKILQAAGAAGADPLAKGEEAFAKAVGNGWIAGAGNFPGGIERGNGAVSTLDGNEPAKAAEDVTARGFAIVAAVIGRDGGDEDFGQCANIGECQEAAGGGIRDLHFPVMGGELPAGGNEGESPSHMGEDFAQIRFCLICVFGKVFDHRSRKVTRPTPPCRGDDAASGKPHAVHQAGDDSGDGIPVQHTIGMKTDHEAGGEMGAAFLNGGREFAIRFQRIAREVEALLVSSSGLRVEGVREDGKGTQRDARALLREFSRKRMDKATEGGRAGESPGEGAGDGIGILDADARENQDRCGVRHGKKRGFSCGVGEI